MFLKKATRRILVASQLRCSHSSNYHFNGAAVLTLGAFLYTQNQKTAEAEEQEHEEIQPVEVQIPEENPEEDEISSVYEDISGKENIFNLF